ncbi:hypothetical protein ACLQ2Q_18170 [Microbacterium sp. DT81.1]|uniref:hypothetical protein n=1 Tax=Microbacterium sp. DT81.1 TaxID=3393413 RepID=UPI003CE9DCFD
MALGGELGIRLIVWMGQTVPRPAPAGVLQALQSVEVTTDREKGDGLQVVFRLVKDQTLDYPLLREPLFTPGNRIVVGVAMGIVPQILLDGVITHQEVSAGGDGTFSITGRDLSSTMDLEEKDEPFDNQPDSVIATRIIAAYPQLGLVPAVTPTTDVPLQVERTPRQHETDLAYLNRMAERNGFVFYIEPVTIGVNTAYWGPENRLGLPQPALTRDMGAMSNVKSLTFSFDALGPVAPEGVFVDPIFKLSIPIPALPSLKFPPLAASPAPALRKEKIRDTANRNAASAAIAALAAASNTPNPVTGDGEVDTAAYGHILRPRGLVGVRGAGLSLDGLYLVDAVTHKLARGEYTQKFRLSREGLGTTTPVVRT